MNPKPCKHEWDTTYHCKHCGMSKLEALDKPSIKLCNHCWHELALPKGHGPFLAHHLPPSIPIDMARMFNHEHICCWCGKERV